MAISLADLPPKYREQAARKFAEQMRGKKKQDQKKPEKEPEKEPTQRKYRNEPETRALENGKILRFDSKKEAARFDELYTFYKAGEIQNLRLQVNYTLQEAYTDAFGNRVKSMIYRADFVYQRDGKAIVEDVKGIRTKEYEIKKNLMLSKYGIEILET